MALQHVFKHFNHLIRWFYILFVIWLHIIVFSAPAHTLHHISGLLPFGMQYVPRMATKHTLLSKFYLFATINLLIFALLTKISRTPPQFKCFNNFFRTVICLQVKLNRSIKINSAVTTQTSLQNLSFERPGAHKN